MSASNIKFEGLSIRDAYDLHYSFEVLRNELFPAGLLEAHFSGEKLSEADKTEEMKKFVEEVLHEDPLNHMFFWNIRFIPFINSSL